MKKVLLFKSGVVLGLAIGIGAAALINKKRKLSSRAVLKKVRRHFELEGEIEACWIEEEVADLLQVDVEIPVFLGGIVRKEEAMIRTYEFTADAKTGTLISVKLTDESEDE